MKFSMYTPRAALHSIYDVRKIVSTPVIVSLAYFNQLALACTLVKWYAWRTEFLFKIT